MLQSQWIIKIKRQIESAKLTKQMYPEFTKSQDKIIRRLQEELKTLNHFKKGRREDEVSQD